MCIGIVGWMRVTQPSVYGSPSARQTCACAGLNFAACFNAVIAPSESPNSLLASENNNSASGWLGTSNT